MIIYGKLKYINEVLNIVLKGLKLFLYGDVEEYEIEGLILFVFFLKWKSNFKYLMFPSPLVDMFEFIFVSLINKFF